MSFSKFILKRKRTVQSKYVGNYKTNLKWRWLEFSDFRLYEFWDDAKNIDFVKSLQEWKTLLKRFDEEREWSVFFLVDVNQNLYFWDEIKKYQTLLNVFSQLSLSALKSNDKIGMWILKYSKIDFFPAKKWRENREFFLTLLKKQFDEKLWKNWDINVSLKKFISLNIKNQLLFILTDKIDQIDWKLLQILSLTNEVIYVNIFDSLESNLEKKNMNYSFWWGGKNWIFSFLNSKKIDFYNLLVHKKIKDFHIKLSKYNIWYVALDEKKNIIWEFQKYFSQKFY